MTRSNGKKILALLATALIFLTAATHAAKPYSQLIVFGDSLSDTGNAYALIGVQAQAPFELIPQAPYAIGGHHFTNGNTWIEKVATDLGLANNVGPAFAEPKPFSNYAVGGTRARSSADPSQSMRLVDQVGYYIYENGYSVPSDALVVVMIGGNDIRDALIENNPGYIFEAVAAIEEQLRLLSSLGAQNVLISNAPNIGKTPAVLAFAAMDPMIPFYAEQLSIGFNQWLAYRLQAVALDTGMNIQIMDTFGAMMSVINNPDSYGFTNVSQSCITPNVVVGALCGNANDYLFWDGIHPTTRGHEVLEDAALSGLGL